MRAATDRLRAQSGRHTLSVTTTHSFAALWLIPRLAGFTRRHPEVDVRISADTRVQDLEREARPLSRFHEAMRTTVADAAIPLRQLVVRAIELKERLPELGPDEEDDLPPYRIWVENRADGGAAFRFALPLEGEAPSVPDADAKIA